MAFTEAQKEQLVGILGGDATTDLLDAHLTSLGDSLTAAKQAYIQGQMNRWVTAGSVFLKIEPKESNEGASIDSERERQDIRGNIARSLGWSYSYGYSSYGTMQIGL